MTKNKTHWTLPMLYKETRHNLRADAIKKTKNLDLSPEDLLQMAWLSILNGKEKKFKNPGAFVNYMKLRMSRMRLDYQKKRMTQAESRFLYSEEENPGNQVDPNKKTRPFSPEVQEIFEKTFPEHIELLRMFNELLTIKAFKKIKLKNTKIDNKYLNKEINLKRKGKANTINNLIKSMHQGLGESAIRLCPFIREKIDPKIVREIPTTRGSYTVSQKYDSDLNQVVKKRIIQSMGNKKIRFKKLVKLCFDDAFNYLAEILLPKRIFFDETTQELGDTAARVLELSARRADLITYFKTLPEEKKLAAAAVVRLLYFGFTLYGTAADMKISFAHARRLIREGVADMKAFFE